VRALAHEQLVPQRARLVDDDGKGGDLRARRGRVSAAVARIRNLCLHRLPSSGMYCDGSGCHRE
jgi:hypothetical protein